MKGRKGRKDSNWGNGGEDNLQEELAAVGLRVKDVTGDGNCFFRACSDQIEVCVMHVSALSLMCPVPLRAAVYICMHGCDQGRPYVLKYVLNTISTSQNMSKYDRLLRDTSLTYPGLQHASL